MWWARRVIMKNQVIKTPALLIVSLVLAITLAAAMSTRVNAQEETVQVTEVTESSEQPQQQEATTVNTYNYVAQEGDSYSLMARKAIQTYGLENNINLSPAQIIFAETNLTNQAGSPQLYVGQQVAIEVSKVQEWVQKAQQMSAEQQAAWNLYVVGVNFDTNNVGQ